MNQSHIHTPDDGRGKRSVLLNGRKVQNCIFADTCKGKVVFYDDPPKIHKYRKRAIRHTKYGSVEIVAL
jgi:hypothetical protein